MTQSPSPKDPAGAGAQVGADDSPAIVSSAWTGEGLVVRLGPAAGVIVDALLSRLDQDDWPDYLSAEERTVLAQLQLALENDPPFGDDPWEHAWDDAAVDAARHWVAAWERSMAGDPWNGSSTTHPGSDS